MALSTRVSVEDYLHSTYHPDCDYIRGEILERSMGEGPHAEVQRKLIVLFYLGQAEWGLRLLPEQRVRVAPERFRVPDLCALPLDQAIPRILEAPPLLCIEILSSEDRLSRIQDRIADYAAFGVKHVWVIDPWKQEAFYGSATGYTPVLNGILKVDGTPVAVSLKELFADLG